jgi:hypothetical protein
MSEIGIVKFDIKEIMTLSKCECEARARELDNVWDTFSRMPSTRLIAEIVGERGNFYQVSVEASRYSRLGLRVFLLSVTASLAQSYLKTRVCPHCCVKFDFEHFLGCHMLGPDLRPLLVVTALEEDWKLFVGLILSRFRVFIHLFRHGQCDNDESELFDALDASEE